LNSFDAIEEMSHKTNSKTSRRHFMITFKKYQRTKRT